MLLRWTAQSCAFSSGSCAYGWCSRRAEGTEGFVVVSSVAESIFLALDRYWRRSPAARQVRDGQHHVVWSDASGVAIDDVDDETDDDVTRAEHTAKPPAPAESAWHDWAWM